MDFSHLPPSIRRHLLRQVIADTKPGVSPLFTTTQNPSNYRPPARFTGGSVTALSPMMWAAFADEMVRILRATQPHQSR